MEKILEEFSDDHHTESSVLEIIDEIVDEEPILSNSYEVDLIFPEKQENKIEDSFGLRDKSDLKSIFFTGFYAFFILLIAVESKEPFLGATDAQVFWAGISAIVLSYFAGHLIKVLSNAIEKRVPPIREYKAVIYSVTGMIAFSSMLIFGYGYVFSKEIPPVVIATFVPASVVAGVQIGKYIESKNQEQSE